MAGTILGNLGPRQIEIFNARTGILPTHPDHGKRSSPAVLMIRAEPIRLRHSPRTPACVDAAAFLNHLREGHCHPAGQTGTPLAMAHGTYSTAIEYAKARLPLKPGEPSTVLLEKITSRFMEGRDPTEFSLMDKFGFVTQGILTGKIFEIAKSGNISLWKQLSDSLNQPELKAAMARDTAGVAEAERRAFLMANLIANKIGYRLVTEFIQQISKGKFLESIQTIIPLAPVVALLSPYIHAFRLPKREWLRQTVLPLSGDIPPFLKNKKRAWFTDTLEDVNGVATTIRKMTAAGVASGHDVTIITCRSEIADHGVPLKNFQPIGEFELPEYELQRLSFPLSCRFSIICSRVDFPNSSSARLARRDFVPSPLRKCSACGPLVSTTPIFPNMFASSRMTRSWRLSHGITCTGSTASLMFCM
jgi:uncharacterized membrane protein (GlpM family)